ncbi:endolytic transglycosylase MltG [Neisseria canis]|uniref:Endolytic murein transglycosylase n=1 Tax=Neisseria canis TaxID=493 RepID=A0A448D548_9NEIS|nr:endolytic transglycosylase MltG [Neisseria canis]OSI12441.1 aminodeoxychorismate lyase [Neisseria canis]VEE99077.1 Periplasmic protein [Neisseria canis]
MVKQKTKKHSGKPVLVGALIFLAAATAGGAFGYLLFAEKDNGQTYRMRVAKGQGISGVSRKLAEDDVIYNRTVMMAGAYVLGVQNKLHTGNYKLPQKVSAWQILKRLKEGRPDTVTIRIIEGMKFSQMRSVINQSPDLAHDTKNLSDTELLQKIDPAAPSSHPEGLFAPDSYEVDAESSDLALYKLAYKTQQKNLQAAWEERQSGLPYKNPYELLTMASIVEKETGHKDDRRHVAAVFVNRLNIGMRLQTDPSVIYGMGDAYKGNIRKSDLQRDTPYNTYTRAGLTPTPISLPGKASLEAAAHPSNANYLYFVSKMDGTGKSKFSHSLSEHNDAVRQYILKK